MKVTIAQTLQHYEKKNLPKDICAGIIIMAVSIPISMGYAQIAGLPAVYGLYGSVFPILLFALFSTSPQFIFGVDAAPAALIGGALIDLHIESGSEAALKVVPVLTLFVAVWLLAFYLMKAGKLVNYISAPVMGGFITGICTTIILMQVPKLFGGTAGTGELLELAGHIGNTLGQIHVPSLIMGVIALVILLAAKKLIPKFPMAVVLMAVGALMTKFLPVREWGIQTLSAVQTGLPRWKAVDLSAVPLKDAITISLSVAVVIMAETVWRDCGHRRTFGAGRTYRKYTWTDPCSVTYNGCDCTGNSAGGKETDTKISDGGRTDGGWSPYDKVSSGQGVGHTDIKCCADGTSAVEGGGSVCSAA